MSKPYTEAHFSTQINENLSWRLREISDLKATILKSDNILQRVLLRAMITICYAHWEGYVRFAANRYFEFVSLRKFQYRELDRQFLKNYFLPRLSALSGSKTSTSDRCELVDRILDASTDRFSRADNDLVNTKANLNFEVFSDICLICAVPIQPFEEKATFIDVFLLKRRNEVAHGENTFVDIKDLDDLTNETVGLMRAFGDALENHVYLKGYRAA